MGEGRAVCAHGVAMSDVRHFWCVAHSVDGQVLPKLLGHQLPIGGGKRSDALVNVSVFNHRHLAGSNHGCNGQPGSTQFTDGNITILSGVRGVGNHGHDVFAVALSQGIRRNDDGRADFVGLLVSEREGDYHDVPTAVIGHGAFSGGSHRRHRLPSSTRRKGGKGCPYALLRWLA